MQLIEGSSSAPAIIQQVRSHADGVDRVMVFLDSNHTHEHVLAEVNAYANLVSVGSYRILFDTVIETCLLDPSPIGLGMLVTIPKLLQISV